MDTASVPLYTQFLGRKHAKETHSTTANTYTDTFEMLVRDIDKGVITEVNPMGELMEV